MGLLNCDYQIVRMCRGDVNVARRGKSFNMDRVCDFEVEGEGCSRSCQVGLWWPTILSEPVPSEAPQFVTELSDKIDSNGERFISRETAS